MADTGFKFPTANGEDYTQFTNPTYAYADDTSWTTGQSNLGHQHDYYTFDFGVPASAPIDGIEIEIEAHDNDSSASVECHVALSHNGGTTYTSEKTDYPDASSASPYTFTLGDSTDNWGRTWADTEFSTANFRLRIRLADDSYPGTNTVYINYVKVKVYYTASGGATATSINIGDSWKSVAAMQINIGDAWKPVAGAKINIGDSWKTIF